MDVPGVRGILVSSRDVGERKWAEESLRKSYELLEAVIENTTDIVFVKDLEGRYLLINQAGAEALGRSVEEIIGKDDAELFSDDDGRRIMERNREVLISGETRTTEDTKTVDGEGRTYLSTEGPYRDDRGNIVGLFGLARDITDRKEIEGRAAGERSPAQSRPEDSPDRQLGTGNRWETSTGPTNSSESTASSPNSSSRPTKTS